MTNRNEKHHFHTPRDSIIGLEHHVFWNPYYFMQWSSADNCNRYVDTSCISCGCRFIPVLSRISMESQMKPN